MNINIQLFAFVRNYQTRFRKKLQFLKDYYFPLNTRFQLIFSAAYYYFFYTDETSDMDSLLYIHGKFYSLYYICKF